VVPHNCDVFHLWNIAAIIIAGTTEDVRVMSVILYSLMCCQVIKVALTFKWSCRPKIWHSNRNWFKCELCHNSWTGGAGFFYLIDTLYENGYKFTQISAHLQLHYLKQGTISSFFHHTGLALSVMWMLALMLVSPVSVYLPCNTFDVLLHET